MVGRKVIRERERRSETEEGEEETENKREKWREHAIGHGVWAKRQMTVLCGWKSKKTNKKEKKEQGRQIERCHREN